MARRAFLGLSRPAWAGCGSQGEKGEPAGPGRGPCGPLSANAAVFSGVSRLAPRPFEDFPSRGQVSCWVFPWAVPPFFPESPAGPFFSLRAAPKEGSRGERAAHGLPVAPRGPSLRPSGLCRRGHAPFPVFTPPAGPFDAHPFWLSEARRAVFLPRAAPGRVLGGRACTRASWGRPARLPASAGPPFLRPLPRPQIFLDPSNKGPRPRVRERERERDVDSYIYRGFF